MATFLLLHYAGIPDEVLVNVDMVEVVSVDDGDVTLNFAGGATLTVQESFDDVARRLGA